MSKNTSITLGDHFEQFISDQVSRGRYGSASEVIRASLRLLEEHERKVNTLQQAIEQGVNSDGTGPLDMNDIKKRAKARSAQRSRKKAGNA